VVTPPSLAPTSAPSRAAARNPKNRAIRRHTMGEMRGREEATGKDRVWAVR
jgi:hypothetical protein